MIPSKHVRRWAESTYEAKHSSSASRLYGSSDEDDYDDDGGAADAVRRAEKQRKRTEMYAAHGMMIGDSSGPLAQIVQGMGTGVGVGVGDLVLPQGGGGTAGAAAALADIRTHHTAAVAELKERLVKAKGGNKARLQYSLEILEAASLGP